MLYSDILRLNNRINPDKTAVLYKEREYTFKEEYLRTNQLANAFINLGLKPKDRVGMLSDNCLEYYEMPHGVIKASLIMVTMNYRLGLPELAYIINDAQIAALVFHEKFRETVNSLQKDFPINSVKHFICASQGDVKAGEIGYGEFLSRASSDDPHIESHEDDIIYLQYTSGTTGTPKGVMLSHRNYISSAKNFFYAGPLNRDDVYMAVMPYYHSVNIAHAAAVLRGCTTVVLNFDPLAVLEAIEKYKITIGMLVPTMIKMVLEHPDLDEYDISSLKTLLYAASPMPSALLKRGLSIWGPIFTQMYGLSESSTLCVCLPKNNHKLISGEGYSEKLRSIGQPIPSVEVKIVDEDGNEVEPDDGHVGKVGEIVIKGPTVARGYWQKPEQTQKTFKNGRLYTGDMARRDKDYYIYLVDRKHDMIISGGVNIYPSEIENILQYHPSIDEVVVFGAPDEKWIEIVVAYIVPQKNDRIKKDEIVEYLKDKIGKYKIPKMIKFVSDIPKDATGKFDRKRLKNEYKENCSG